MALFAVVEAIIPVFFAPIYSKVYSTTNPIEAAAASDSTTAASVLANATASATAALTTLSDAGATAATVLMESATEAVTDMAAATEAAFDIANTTIADTANATASAMDMASTAASDMADAMTSTGTTTGLSRLRKHIKISCQNFQIVRIYLAFLKLRFPAAGQPSSAFLWISCGVSLCGLILFA